MEFGDYQDARTYAKNLPTYSFAKNLPNIHEIIGLAELAKDCEAFYKNEINISHRLGPEFGSSLLFESEMNWWKNKRPYFNVWPVILETLKAFKIENVPLSEISKPKIGTFEVRFPKGSIPHVEAVLIHVQDHPKATGIMFVIAWDKKNEYKQQPYNEYVMTFHKHSAKDLISSINIDTSLCEHPESDLLAIRCCMSILLMQNDPDAIEPDILFKDRSKWDSATDSEKKRLEEKAVNRRGRIGFHVGRICETSPHWRNPHLALFWTGKGRTKPKIKLRSGCVVKRNRLKEVPTGYHDNK